MARKEAVRRTSVQRRLGFPGQWCGATRPDGFTTTCLNRTQEKTVIQLLTNFDESLPFANQNILCEKSCYPAVHPWIKILTYYWHLAQKNSTRIYTCQSTWLLSKAWGRTVFPSIVTYGGGIKKTVGICIIHQNLSFPLKS